MKPSVDTNELPRRTDVFLVGAGVVGRAILTAHIDAGISVCIADQNESFVVSAMSELNLDSDRWQVSDLFQLGGRLPAIELVERNHVPEDVANRIVIESIAERLDVKQSFFAEVEKLFGDNAILCSNTSTLPIRRIAEKLDSPQRFCGMHFFMPVTERPAVELIAGKETSDATIQRCTDHIKRIGKEPLAVGDGPGFVVNRLLSPYLNEAMLLLGRGISAEQIERAALAYGMPMSPLEMIDLIGARTAFDAGRVYWQSFPTRVDPSPILPALIKRKRFGMSMGAGLYDYEGKERSKELSPITLELRERYRRNEVSLGDEEVTHLLSIPMWIEAALAYRDGIVERIEQFDLAMRGGLGYQSSGTWLEYFDTLGSPRILEMIQRFSSSSMSLKAPTGLIDALQRCSPTTAMKQFAK